MSLPARLVAPRPQLQHGAVLMVTLVLLLMMSILGIVSLRGASLEHQMSTNAMHSGTVFQAADSAAELALNDTNNINAAWALRGNPLVVSTDLGYGAETAIESQAEMRYHGKTTVPGYSTGGRVCALRISADGHGAAPGVHATAHVQHGATRIVMTGCQ